MPDRGWRRRFEDPIPLPRGRQLVTLKDAGTYITKLPKAEHESLEWQAAIEALIMAAEDRGPLMHARIGVMRALNRRVERVFDPSRKERHWGERKLARDQQPPNPNYLDITHPYLFPVGRTKTLAAIHPIPLQPSQ